MDKKIQIKTTEYLTFKEWQKHFCEDIEPQVLGCKLEFKTYFKSS